MRKIICVFFVLINFIGFSQNISFNKVIAPYGNISSASFAATGIVKQGSNYILSMTGFDTTNITTDIQSLYFAKVDSNGENFEIIKKYNQPDTNYYDGYGAFIKTHNGGFCYVGDIDSNYNLKVQHFMMLFDSNMNNVLTKIIPHDNILEAINQVRETHDHGFIIVGQRYVTDYVDDVLIIRTDSFGNQLWRKSISTGEYGNGGQIEETPDNGLLICGYRDSYTTGQGDPFLIKTDSAGNLVWIKYLGNSSEHDGGAAFAITQEGDYIVALGYANYTYTNNTDWLGLINVIKFSPDGTEISNRMYDTIRWDNNVNKIQVLSNNDFILMGSSVAGIDTNYYATFMFKFNANGDSLWRRIYYNTKNYLDRNILCDNLQDSDGGITDCGWVQGNALSPSQQVWILKTDSNGYAPGCEPTGIEEIQYTKTEEMRVYPNPTKEILTIETNSNIEQRLEILNLFGQTVYTSNINKKTTVNTSTFANGVYILKLSSDKETMVKKFIKE